MFRFAPPLAAEVQQQMLPVLELGRRQGIIGPGALIDHVGHALGFGEVWHDKRGDWAPNHVVDLGSGAGLPSLVLALVWPDSRWLLTETRKKRADFLSRAARRLELSERVEVWSGDVQDVNESLDATVDLVTARAFGLPAITAECAAGLLGPDGSLVVSEPGSLTAAEFEARWPTAGLHTVGMGPAHAETAGDHHFVHLSRIQHPRIDDSPIESRSRRQMERDPRF